MNAISKASILRKTHYGLTIYSHILRLYYPEKSCQREQSSSSFETMPSAADFARSDQVVLRLVGRDCGLCRNPFNANKKTLHIFIHKEIPCQREQDSTQFEVIPNAVDIARSDNISGKEHARHEDSEISCQREQRQSCLAMSSAAEIACYNDMQNAISPGDAFDFAELHYKQRDEELLQTLNTELNLRIGQKRNLYKNKFNTDKFVNCPQSLHRAQSKCPDRPVFSFFKAPITNTKPYKTVNLLQIYNVITGHYYKGRTQKLRTISDVGQARRFKAANFDYCTFSGIFTTRNDKALIKHSGLLCLDFDHLTSLDVLRNQLLKDEYFDTQLLFVSPSGDGLKWIIPIDTTTTTHSNYFLAVANYILQTYGVAVDKSGRDISRACFLPHDPQAFINPVYL